MLIYAHHNVLRIVDIYRGYEVGSLEDIRHFRARNFVSKHYRYELRKKLRGAIKLHNFMHRTIRSDVYLFKANKLCAED